MKYRVMLIDDDVPMLKYLEQLLPWEELGLKIAATSFSSVQALRLFKEKEPHLVISDIGLPQMDGIELVAEMKKINPNIRVLFLTCHEDFHYARAAIQMSADDYLIKDELTPDKLRASVGKSVAMLQEMSGRMEELSNRIEIQRHKDLLKQSFIRQVLSGDESDSVKQLGTRIGVQWKKDDFLLGWGAIDYASFLNHYQYKDMALIRFAFYNIAEEIASDSDYLSVFQMEDGSLLLVLNFEKKLDFDASEWLKQYMERVRRAAEEFIKIRVRFVGSRPFPGRRGIGTTLARLKQFDESLYYDSVPITAMLDWKAVEWTYSSHHALSVKDSFMSAFREGKPSAMKEVLRRYAAEARVSHLSPAQWTADCSQLIRSIEFETGCKTDSEAYHTCLRQSGRLQETLDLLENRIDFIMNAQSSAYIAFSKTPKLQIIDSYVREHLTENITSVTMANHLYLNPSYFSRYFKKLTGMNFTDYVHRLKMEQAAQMIRNKTETIEAISMKLGYSDRTYFSKVFKKYNGVSPSDFK